MRMYEGSEFFSHLQTEVLSAMWAIGENDPTTQEMTYIEMHALNNQSSGLETSLSTTSPLVFDICVGRCACQEKKARLP